eukprot:Seg992.4 transcript_id=Seg992.4/GoldUCD/mRNA.D3Y31 product="hypothetical protein" protein_id=Seg992.4/GoldUCD/D3Y31
MKREKIPESQIAPIVPSFAIKKNPYGYYCDNEGGPIKTSHSIGKGSMYRNRIKWLNSPVLGTQYKKEMPVKSDINKNQIQTVRQEITRSGSENNVDTTETEVTETTETIEGGTTLTTVKRKVVTVIQGKEEVIEDSQLIVDGNDTAFSSVIDGHEEPVSNEEPIKSEHTGDSLLTPGSPVSQHSSTRSDDEGGDDDHDRKKVKKQRSFKKMFGKKEDKKKPRGKKQ